MSGTINNPTGLGTHGGGGDFRKGSKQTTAMSSAVTNQQILPLPAGLDDTTNTRLIQVDFAIEVSTALMRAYGRVRDELLKSDGQAPAEVSNASG